MIKGENNIVTVKIKYNLEEQKMDFFSAMYSSLGVVETAKTYIPILAVNFTGVTPNNNSNMMFNNY